MLKFYFKNAVNSIKGKRKGNLPMGMSGSQARLLSLTARLHDVELKAQNLMANKIALSTQKDELYEDYCDALDAKILKVAYRDATMNANYEDANYRSLCTYSKNRSKNYALRDNKSGYIIVSNDVKEAYDTYGRDKYAFVYAFLGFEGQFGNEKNGNDSFNHMGVDVGIGTAQEGWEDAGFKYANDETNSLYMTEAEAKAYEDYIENNPNSSLESYYQALLDSETKGKGEQKEALNTFRKALYEACSEDIYLNMYKNLSDDGNTNVTSEWSEKKAEFNFYIQLWEAINEAGGCQVVDPQFEGGDDGTAWLDGMVDAGQVSILVWDDNGSGDNCWSETNAATSYNENYLQEMEDETAQKKAEVKYKRELDIINTKEKRFDTELSKLETERTAITTEMDSISKVRDDNIERTFGIFS